MEWLEATYPKAFDFKQPIPLKKGIRQELLANGSPFSKIQLMNGLKAYVRGHLYLKAVIRYQWRHDLNGKQAAEILDDEKQYSRELLRMQRERKKIKRQD